MTGHRSVGWVQNTREFSPAHFDRRPFNIERDALVDRFALVLKRVFQIAAMVVGVVLAIPTAFPAGANPETELTTAAAIRNLSPEQSGRKTPCKVQGTVTCSSAQGLLLFIQDATAGVYVYSEGTYPPQGSKVEVIGFVDRGLFSPIIIAKEVRVLGTAALPPALPVAMEKLASGRFDSQWVEIEGVVVRQYEEWGNLVLVVASGSSRTTVRILSYGPDSPNWVDARVQIQGVAGTAYNDRRQLTGFHLLTQTPKFIKVIEPAPADPFSAELRSSRSLMAFSPTGQTDHRARLRGVVTWAWPEHGFYLRDGDGEVKVFTHGTNSPKPGQVVDVSGFQVPTPLRPQLTEAVFRVTDDVQAVEPRFISAEDAARGTAEGQLVTIEGTVLQVSERHTHHQALLVSANGKVFRARYLDGWFAKNLSGWVGAQVRLTGICTQDSAPNSGSEVFSIWLRSPEDFVILGRSSAWWQRLALWITSGLAGTVLVGSAWLALLRRRVKQQTAAIQKREQLLEDRFLDLFDNANDIIFTHDLDGRMTSINSTGESLLGIREKECPSLRIESFIEPEDLAKYRSHLLQLRSGIPREYFEVRLKSRTGRPFTVEVNSRLLYQDGQPMAAQCIARNITERKVAEAALWASERQLRASMAERERLGRDLHDGIIQSIYAVGLRLQDCQQEAPSLPPVVNERLQQVTGELNRVIRQVRGFIEGLEQNRITGEEFKTSLKALVAMLDTQPARIDVQIEDPAASLMSSQQATQLLNIAREALSNSVRHSQASRITVSLLQTQGVLRFEVQDDGAGFDAAHPDPKGRGLQNMAARARELPAILQLKSEIGHGTRITVDLPLPTLHPVS